MIPFVIVNIIFLITMIYRYYLKFICDKLFSFILLPFFFLLFFVIIFFVYFEDRGPIIYSSYRLGVNGEPFKMFKFRTMIVNAPDIRLSDGSTYNGDDDPRITRVGRFLRKTSIDELPQILNVLLGDMSFIGPRPDPVDWLDKYSEKEKIILSVRPGITGYNQAYYRNSADGAMKLKNDVYYAENISFSLDMKIFFKTIKTVLLHENINVDQARLKS